MKALDAPVAVSMLEQVYPLPITQFFFWFTITLFFFALLSFPVLFLLVYPRSITHFFRCVFVHSHAHTCARGLLFSLSCAHSLSLSSVSPSLSLTLSFNLSLALLSLARARACVRYLSDADNERISSRDRV